MEKCKTHYFRHGHSKQPSRGLLNAISYPRSRRISTHPPMRNLLLSLLLGLIVLPAQGQDFVKQWRSFVEGTWAAEQQSPDVVLEIETTADANTDLLRLTLRGSHSPKSFDRETITCRVEWRVAGQLTIQECPQTTLSSTSPSRTLTLQFAPGTKAHHGLLKIAKKFTGQARRAGESLIVGTEKRYRLRKMNPRLLTASDASSTSSK